MGGIGGPAKDAAKSYSKGSIGVISRSGGMTTEMSSTLSAAGLGISTAVSIGGDAIIGQSYAELMPLFEADAETKGIAIYSEPGGPSEAMLAEYMTVSKSRLPVVAFMAGRFMDAMPGMRFGHAGTPAGIAIGAFLAAHRRQFDDENCTFIGVTGRAEDHSRHLQERLPGIRWFQEASRHTLMDLRVQLSSCVPSTHMETAGARIDAEDLAAVMGHPSGIGLAEFMNYPGVIHRDPGCMAKLRLFAGGHVDGHCPQLTGRDLNAYIAAGIRTEHEATTAAEAREKLQKGMRVLIREGSVSKDLNALAPVLTDVTSAYMCLCTDDRNPLDIAEHGHLDYMIRTLIRRRKASGRAYLAAVNPVVNPTLDAAGVLVFQNAVVDAVAHLGVGHRRRVVLDPVEEVLLVLPLGQSDVAILELDPQDRRVAGGHLPAQPRGVNPSVGALDADESALGGVVVHDHPIGVAVLHLEIEQHVPQPGTGRRVFALALHADRAGPFAVVEQLRHVERVRAPVGDHPLARVPASHPARPRVRLRRMDPVHRLSLIPISEPTRPYQISYAVFRLKKKRNQIKKYSIYRKILLQLLQ